MFKLTSIKILASIMLLSMTTLSVNANIKEEFKNGVKAFFKIGETYLTNQEIEELYLNEKLLPALDEICSFHKKSYLIDDQDVQKGYKKFLSNKNNMYKNRVFYENVNFWANDNKKIFDYQIDKLYKDYEFYNYKSMYGTYEQKGLYIKEAKFKEISKQQVDEINDMYEKWQKIADEVYHYSFAYEMTKRQNYYKNKYGAVLGGQLDLLLLSPYGGPETGKYYNTHGYLTVTQAIPGGVIVSSGSAQAFGYQPHFKHAFIVTSKNYVTGQNITGNFQYVGTYSYINPLKARVTVWKFKELNPPSERFYFVAK